MLMITAKMQVDDYIKNSSGHHTKKASSGLAGMPFKKWAKTIFILLKV